MRHLDTPPIQTQHLIFNLFGDYVNPRGGAVWTSGLIEVLNSLQVSERAARSTLSRMKSKGWLLAGREGRRSFYALSPRGKAVLDEGAQRLFGPRPSTWDGCWHLVAYSLPQSLRKRRRQLRTRLTWLGYGMLEPGLMAAAYPRAEEVISLVDDLKVQQYVHFFSHTKSELTDSEAIVTRCWNIHDLNSRYEEFIDRHHPTFKALVEKRARDNRLPCSESFAHRFWVTYEYSAFPREDPNLPPELLPDDWRGAEAADLLLKYRSLLQKPAEEFVQDTLPTLQVSLDEIRGEYASPVPVQG